MSLGLDKTEPVPLSADGEGVIRVAKTRVTLDTLAEAFQQGATAEEIAQQAPTVSLADIYSVLGYLLRHQAEVTDYLSRRASVHDAARAENERRCDPEGVRARLLARRG